MCSQKVRRRSFLFCKLLIINDSDCWKYVRKVRIVRIYLSKACLKRAFFAEIAFSQVEITRDCKEFLRTF